MKTGPLDWAIKQLKYHGQTGWSIIFGRVLLGHLGRDTDVTTTDLIIPMPTLLLPPGTPGAGGLDHVALIVKAAAEQDYGDTGSALLHLTTSLICR